MNLSAKIATIEFDGDEVRVAVVRTGRRLPRVLESHTATARYASPEDRTEALASATKRVLEALTSSPAVYVLCASSRYAVARKISIPFRGRRRVAAAVPFELEPHLAFPVEELVVDHATLRVVDGKTEVLAVGMRRGNLAEHLAVLEAAGVDVAGIGIDVAGLTALWRAGRPGLTGLHAAVHVRNTSSIFTVVHNKSLAFFRHLPFTEDDFQAPLADAVVRELQNSIRSFLATWKGDDEISDLTITGTELSEAERMPLEEALDVPVRYESLLEALREPSGRDKREGDAKRVEQPGLAVTSTATPALPTGNTWAAAIGVALGAAGASPSFNFRKADLRAPNLLRGVIHHAVFSTCLTLIALVGYSSYCYVDFYNNVARIKQIGEQTWELFAEVFPDAQYINAVPPPETMGGINQLHEAMALEIGETEQSGEVFPLELFGQATLIDVLEALSESMPSDSVTITSVKITPRRSASPRIDIDGEVMNLDAFNQAFATLKRSAVLQIEEEPTRRDEAGKTTFRIVAGLKEDAHAQD